MELNCGLIIRLVWAYVNILFLFEWYIIWIKFMCWLFSNCFLQRNVISSGIMSTCRMFLTGMWCYIYRISWNLVLTFSEEEQRANYQQIMVCLRDGSFMTQKKYDNWRVVMTLINNKDWLNRIKEENVRFVLTDQELTDIWSDRKSEWTAPRQQESINNWRIFHLFYTLEHI